MTKPQPEPEEARALTPLDYQQILHAHDPEDSGAQPEADFWRKVKMDSNGRPVRRRDGTPAWVTPPIIRHAGVQQLARLFGVQIEHIDWVRRDVENLSLCCEVVVKGYTPLSTKACGYHLAPDYPVPDYTRAIGELNSANAGRVGREYPQCMTYKRGYDRAVLEHLGLFRCYGDSEEPRFAQGAAYEQPPAEQSASATAPKFAVPASAWAKMPEDVRHLARALIDKGVSRDKLDGLYETCFGEADQLRRALCELDEKLEAPSD
jgi:hypothetical protein